MTDKPANIDNGDKPLIDPELEEDLKEVKPEDPFLTEYASMSKSGSSEKTNVASEWIGEGNDWKTKTKLSAEQIIAMTQIRMMPQVFPELDEIDSVLMGLVQDMEKYAVSHEGLSREQQVSVLRAMFSGEHHEDSDRRSMLLSALAMPDNDDE